MKNVFIIGVLFLLAVSFAIAAEKNDTDNAKGKPLGNETNMTYGQCVSQAAEAKNGCYSTVKEARSACIEAAKNASDDGKQCKSDYKKDMKACKADFKSAKKTCAQSYKPGFFEKMKSSMK